MVKTPSPKPKPWPQLRQEMASELDIIRNVSAGKGDFFERERSAGNNLLNSINIFANFNADLLHTPNHPHAAELYRAQVLAAGMQLTRPEDRLLSKIETIFFYSKSTSRIFTDDIKRISTLAYQAEEADTRPEKTSLDERIAAALEAFKEDPVAPPESPSPSSRTRHR